MTVTSITVGASLKALGFVGTGRAQARKEAGGDQSRKEGGQRGRL